MLIDNDDQPVTSLCPTCGQPFGHCDCFGDERTPVTSQTPEPLRGWKAWLAAIICVITWGEVQWPKKS